MKKTKGGGNGGRKKKTEKETNLRMPQKLNLKGQKIGCEDTGFGSGSGSGKCHAQIIASKREGNK